jgi:hypothetical protein
MPTDRAHEHQPECGNYKKKAKKPEESLVDKLRLPLCLHSKTGLCKHTFGCTENAVRGFYRMFWITFAFKTAIGNLMLLIKPTKLIKSL